MLGTSCSCMKQFSDNLRQRCQELDLSLAEAAKRADLSDRRFANYAAGSREPDLATLVRIAVALNTTPDRLLGVEKDRGELDEKEKLRLQLATDAKSLDVRALRMTVDVVRAILDHMPGRARSK